MGARKVPLAAVPLPNGLRLPDPKRRCFRAKMQLRVPAPRICGAKRSLSNRGKLELSLLSTLAPLFLLTSSAKLFENGRSLSVSRVQPVSSLEHRQSRAIIAEHVQR